MTALSDLLTHETIALDETAEDWQDAIRVAGRLLESAGVTEPEYTQSMVDSVHENGPYIVLAPGFAFPHARPSEAVHRTGMSWVRLASPVEFGSRANDPVTLVVALAATDTSTHQQAMASLATVLTDTSLRASLDEATSAAEVHAILRGDAPTDTVTPSAEAELSRSEGGGRTRDHILTVCGNGLGTSLFLKNTLEQVLDRWGWGGLITVEATDTVSARGKAKDADLILTSGEIAHALGDVGVPLVVIENFTSQQEIDAALRASYDI
ncbi:PTS sugar transporter subunit IIA [Nocardioides pinisoli]|uniref:Ascorbate-specific PTS system EIIA component n=1 Tax=Nocardioides pinisoli TaxID=2950279 RepID=A0ABT1KY11_9ACTN|nr:PTS sugar transporter subunit IIA [Nocardioides pinisoli]MCP3422635.1 PTS sugar transporter subunit IIA [Nocardioides pinisoli]